MTAAEALPRPRTPEEAAVELSFSALPAHVRTARLVATAVARRSGVDENVLDAGRLAVGEACSRAVDLHRRHCPTEPVQVRLLDAPRTFSVEVTDVAPVPDGPDDVLAAFADDAAGGAPEEEVLPSGVGLAVITGLVDDVSVERRSGGTAVRMTWPATGGARGA